VKLSNELVMSAPVDQAWALLTDLQRIAPSMPGAVLEKVEGEDFTGTVSVRVGPIAVKYRGTARISELDPASHRAVISARGADASGQGSVEALITARLSPEAQGTKILVDTDLDISGRIAQFGRGALADVSARLMAQFVRNLEETLLRPVPGTGPGEPASPAAPPDHDAPTESIDLLAAVGPVLAKRALPVLIGVLAGAMATRWWLRRSAPAGSQSSPSSFRAVP
jgi:carbon monoxide dehydrogenase subunit G